MPATTPNLALPYPVAADTADVPRDIQALAVKLDTSGATAAALPASPTDGQLHYWLVDAANGVVWQMRWRAAAAKWEFVGGAPLTHQIVGTDSISSTVYVDAPTNPGPQIMLPTFTGTMDILVTLTAVCVPAVNDFAYASLKLGAATVSDADSVFQAQAPTAINQSTGSRTMRRNGLASASLLKVQYKSPLTGGAGSYNKRELAVYPVRVG